MQIRPPLTGFRSDKSSMEKGYPVITVTPIMSDARAGFTREEVLTFRRAFRSGREFDAYRRTVRTQKHRSADRPITSTLGSICGRRISVCRRRRAT